MSESIKVIKYINDHYDLDEEYYLVFGKHIPNSKFFCPFHENVNTPSAKRYGNVIHCFGACGKSFGVYDFLKRFNPQRIIDIKSSTFIQSDLTASALRRFVIKHINRNKSIDEILTDILC